jgi:hypothetical protein
MVPHSRAGERRYCFDARTTHYRRTRVLCFSESIMTTRTRRPGSACHFGLFVPEYSKSDCNECLILGKPREPRTEQAEHGQVAPRRSHDTTGSQTRVSLSPIRRMGTMTTTTCWPMAWWWAASSRPQRRGGYGIRPASHNRQPEKPERQH